ncbi:unnamed protein product [Adineta ricciae]|uniref:Uncharacterized protein n=1 Tax=Adineta ricciae TaxID=249248 RepID=A0A815C665_ADIRI|nr:unnamed protein product [Adineta ricciae]CAF1635448.1 unnamed protein product [Adineta ricciae]
MISEYLILIILVRKISMSTRLSLNASWNQNGTIVIGSPNGMNGTSLAQLSHPVGITISDDDVLYIADTGNHRVLVVDLNNSTSTYAISNLEQSDLHYDVFIFNTSLHVLNSNKKRVQKMSLNGSNSVTGTNLSELVSPIYMFIDKSGNIYVSDAGSHQAFVFRSNSTHGSAVAGNGTNGTTYEQLNRPYGIFVNDVGTIYVADCGNNRIMKWTSRVQSGVCVVGDVLTKVYAPTYIIVDENEYMYIAEADKSRITRYAPDSTFSVCIVGCTDISRIVTNQLSSPHSLAFDSHGSLYVCDWGNHRVHKFELLNSPAAYNQPKIVANQTWDQCGNTIINGTALKFYPLGMFIDSNDTIYVADTNNKYIRI